MLLRLFVAVPAEPPVLSDLLLLVLPLLVALVEPVLARVMALADRSDMPPNTH